MGKNAKRRKEAKLREKLMRAAPSNDECHCADPKGNTGSSLPVPVEKISVSTSATEDSLPTVFNSEQHEPITDELIRELVDKNGWKEQDIRNFKSLGMNYCRERNSFIPPPEAF